MVTGLPARSEQSLRTDTGARTHTHTLTRGIGSVSRETSPTQRRDEAATHTPDSYRTKKKKKNQV